MKLLYAYVGNFSDIFVNQEFVFSNEILVSYIEEEMVLNVKENEQYRNDFYGDIICDITAIVGKNGVGKTTLLNLIGRRMDDRLEHSKLKDHKEIIDKYFLVYYVEDDMLYFEGTGNIPINNIKGYEIILANNDKMNTIFCSFYLKKTDLSIVEDYENDCYDKIYYLGKNYIEGGHDSFYALLYNNNPFLPRITDRQVPWMEWYHMYKELYNKGIITSGQISISFSKIEDYGEFVIQPKNKELPRNIDNLLLYTREDIGDYFSHFMSCIVWSYKVLSKKIYGDTLDADWSKLFEKYKTANMFSLSDYKSIFNKCKMIIRKNAKNIEISKIDILIMYIELVNKLFYALYAIKGNIIPELTKFHLKLDGEKENDKLKYFFQCFIETQKFVEEFSKASKVREDWKYDEDSFLGLSENKYFEFNMPINVNNVNMSDGEYNLISLLSKIDYEVKEYLISQSARRFRQEKTLIILVDEIEDAMHLEWSRNLINTIIGYLENRIIDFGNGIIYHYREGKMKVQLILTTHSPFLLSDLNKNSIIALDFYDGKFQKRKNLCTFAQNIQKIIIDEFFVNDCYGSYATKKVQEIIGLLNKEEKLNNHQNKLINSVIDEIGEPILKNKLKKMHLEKIIKSDDDEKKKTVDLLNGIYGDLSNEKLREKLKNILEDIET